MPEERPNDFVHLLGALTAAGVEFVIVGGAAAILHGVSTATYDLDVLMSFTLPNCDRLLQAVNPFNPRLSHTPQRLPLRFTAQELTSFKNLYLSTDLGRLNVLGSLPPVGTADQVLGDAEVMIVGGLSLRVASLATLIQVKAAMGRPKDKQVEAELRAIAEVRNSGKP